MKAEEHLYDFLKGMGAVVLALGTVVFLLWNAMKNHAEKETRK